MTLRRDRSSLDNTAPARVNGAEKPEAGAADPMSIPMARNVALYPWFRACQSLLFWQAVWFLYFQDRLSATAAIQLYAVYDIASTLLEVPSGYMSDRLGRRRTLLAAALAGGAAVLFIGLGDSFAAFAVGEALIGASAAFVSGTDSALLYQSLAAEGRAAEVERQELRAWRFAFTALAASALAGGLMTLLYPPLPYLAGALGFAAMAIIAFRFTEPPAARHGPDEGPTLSDLGQIRAALAQPVVAWLFALSVAMYIFSHIPFVFGQPFIADALAALGAGQGAPAVSGAVTAAMMTVSLGTSLFATPLRVRLGLTVLLLVAFALQIAISATLAATGSALAIAVLLLRMVPVSLSRPFITARMQPLLHDRTRATFLSVQSLAGRLIFAATLFLASAVAGGTDTLSHGTIRLILGAYCAAGLACLLILAVTARRRGI
ncbi:MFS transporter [Oceaniglobus roseus]|uniref:MFS transporter n=1 Tax=Oceaniglobus roseus TaxID=1737570 RepID=UPI001FE94B80|nr:MFS transporter [Kandeliimicrobium roseum]